MSCACGSQVFGVVPECATLELVEGGDYVWNFELKYPPGHAQAGAPQPFPSGQLFYRIFTDPVETKWQFTIAGSTASIKTESEEVAKIKDRTRFHLVWLPAGELAGGQVWAVGKVRVVK
jgi:hypothetical protein